MKEENKIYQGLINPLKLNISDKIKEILGKKEK